MDQEKKTPATAAAPDDEKATGPQEVSYSQGGQIVILEPADRLIGQILPVLGRERDTAIHRAATDAEAVQIAMLAAPCVALLSISSKEDVLRTTTFLRGIQNLVRAQNVKILLVSKFRDERISDTYFQLGCNEFVQNTVSPNTLYFKIRLHAKSMRAKRRTQEDDPKLVMVSRDKKRDEPETTVVPGATTEGPGVMEIAQDIWLFRGEKPKKVGTQWIVQVEGPDPFAGEWVEGAEDEKGKRKWLWKSRNESGDEVPTQDVQVAWEFNGQKPVFNSDTGKWKFVGSKPALSYVKKGQGSVSKMAPDGEGRVLVAPDAPDAEKNLEKLNRIAAVAKKKKSLEATAKEATESKKGAVKPVSGAEFEEGQAQELSLKKQPRDDEPDDEKRNPRNGGLKPGPETERRSDQAKTAKELRVKQATHLAESPWAPKGGEPEEDASPEKGALAPSKSKSRGKNELASSPFGSLQGDEPEPRPARERSVESEGKASPAEFKKTNDPRSKASAKAELAKEDQANDRKRSKEGAEKPAKTRDKPLHSPDSDDNGDGEKATAEPKAAKPGSDPKPRGKSPSPEPQAENAEGAAPRTGRSGKNHPGEDHAGKYPGSPKSRERPAGQPPELKATKGGPQAGMKDDPSGAPETEEKRTTKDGERDEAEGAGPGGKETPRTESAIAASNESRSSWRARNRPGPGPNNGKAKATEAPGRCQAAQNRKLRRKNGDAAEEKDYLEYPAGHFGSEHGVWERVQSLGYLFVIPDFLQCTPETVTQRPPYWHVENGTVEGPFYDRERASWLFERPAFPKAADSFGDLPIPFAEFLREVARGKSRLQAVAQNQDKLRRENERARDALELPPPPEPAPGGPAVKDFLKGFRERREKLRQEKQVKTPDDSPMPPAPRSGKSIRTVSFFVGLSDKLGRLKPLELHLWLAEEAGKVLNGDSVAIFKLHETRGARATVLASSHPRFTAGQEISLTDHAELQSVLPDSRSPDSGSNEGQGPPPAGTVVRALLERRGISTNGILLVRRDPERGPHHQLEMIFISRVAQILGALLGQRQALAKAA